MSVAFSPAALAFPHPSGQPSHSPPPPGAGANVGGRAPVLGTTAPVTSILGARVTRGGAGADTNDRGTSERQAQQQAKGAAVDRRVRQLLDQSAPVFFSGTDILAFMPNANAAATNNNNTNADGTPSSSSGAHNDDIALGTPSFADRAVTPVSVLSNYAESSAARDLLLQTLTASDRARLRDLHHRWRATAQRGIRTTHAVLFVCLQLGGDPPEHPRISPRAKLEAWVDASQESAKLVRRGAEAVIEALEGQYRALHRELSVRRHNEATIDDARAALQQMRRKAGPGNRMLVHYNGHGMPSITANGELWFFDARREHFVPFNIIDVSAFAQSPTVYVIDCNNAAAVISMWRQSVDPAHRESSRDVFLCACGEDQVLPTNPALPADFFTACLTTPLRAALLWYDQYSDRQPLLPTVDHTVIDRIPGDENNKRTPRGELAFILAAVADTVAWCTVEPFQFYALFRQDMLLRTLLRNFLIADRLMRETGCTPRSHPPLPYTAHLHPAWQSWEVALEGVLAQVPALLKDPTLKYVPSPYWRDQLTSFEVGLSVIGTNVAVVPEQLPCVVLALGQTAYRVRALLLLARYFEQGTRAVHHGLACGVVGYIVRLLQNREHSMPLLCIWMHVLRANPEVACAELVRAGAESLLVWVMSLTDSQCRLKPIKNTLEELPGPTPYVLASANRENAANSTTAAAAAAAAAASTTAGPRMSAGGASAAYADPNGSFFNATASAASPAPPPGMSQASFAGQSVNNPPLPQSAPHPSAPNPVTSYVSPAGLTLPMARTIAAFLLSSMVNAGAERTAAACWNAGVVNACLQLISDSTDVEGVSWGCLLLGRMCELLPTARRSVLLEAAYQHDVFGPLLSASNPAVRASAVNLLGKLLAIDIPSLEGEDRDRAVEVVTSILKHLLHELHGVSTEVRVETAVATLGFIFHQSGVLDANFYGAILGAVASGDFSAVVAMAASGPSAAVPVPSKGDSHPASPSTRSPSNNPSAAAASAALHFRVLETWRRVSVVSRLSAGGGPILGDAVDAGAGAASPNDGRRALRLDCPPIAVPSSRSGATAAPPQQPPAAPSSSPPPPSEGPSSPSGQDKQQQQRSSGGINGPQPLSHSARTKLADLVHDAALMAHAAVKSIDTRLSAVANDALRLMSPASDSPQCPKSNRIAREGNRLALSLDREARHTMSDAQRCAERRSLDLARQAVLRAEDTAAYLGRLGQQQQPAQSGAALNTPAPSTSHLSPREGPSQANISMSAGGTANSNASPTAPSPASMAAPGPTALQPFTLNTLASSHANDATVVAMALRELEPQMSSVDDQRVLTVTNYEKLRFPQVLAQLILPASIGHAAQLHVVNDMSSTPIALCVGSTGACVALHTHHVDPVSGSVLTQVPGDKPRAVDPFLTFYASSSAYSGGPGDATGGAGGGGTGTSASSFAALTPSVAAGCPVASAYRNRDSLLFFAGVPNQIRRFSLAQEMLEQVLTVPGTGHITHLHATPTNEIFAGKDDGTVKIFDTRQHTGYWSFAGAVGDAPSSSSGGSGGGAKSGPQVSPRVVSVSRSESSPNDIIVAHRTCIKVYDARKRSAPKRTIDLGGPNAAPSQLITAFEVSTQLPFMAATLADGTVIPMSLRGHQACEADIRVAAAPVGGVSATMGVSPQQSQARFASTPASVPQTVTGGLSWRNGHVLAVHPHRPVLAVGKQMIALTPDESRLATALAL